MHIVTLSYAVNVFYKEFHLEHKIIADNVNISGSFKTWQKILKENLQNITPHCSHESKDSKNGALLQVDLLVFELKSDMSLVLKGPVIEELVDFDAGINIKSEAPKIKAFGQAIQTFAEILCNLLETPNSCYKFKVHPC